MDRRDFIKNSSIVLLGVSAGYIPQIKARAEQGYDISSTSTQVIDVHTHLPPEVSLDTIIDNFDRAGVEKAVVMARGGMRPRDTLDFHRKYPDRVIPFFPFQVGGWMKQRPAFIDGLRRNLDKGIFKGLGEVILRHYSVPEMGAPEFDIPADGQMMLQVMKIGAEYNLPILIHMEAEPATMPKLETALSYEPKTKVIWGHCGRATAAEIDRMLTKYPQLYCDIAALDRTRPYGQEKNPITSVGLFSGIKLKSEWKDLFTKHYDRFLFGVDGVFPPHYKEYMYVDAALALRKLLAELKPEVAKEIGYGNAKKLLRL